MLNEEKMKKEIIVSKAYYVGDFTYIPVENQWKCSYKVYYGKEQNFLQKETCIIDVYFSEEGKVETAKSVRKKYLDEIFIQMKNTVEFEQHFQKCKKVIEEIQKIKDSTPDHFSKFSFLFDEKRGSFSFENSKFELSFTFKPTKGIDEIIIYFEKTHRFIPRVSLREKSTILFGENLTNVLNELLKKRLKLRYYF